MIRKEAGNRELGSAIHIAVSTYQANAAGPRVVGLTSQKRSSNLDMRRCSILLSFA